MYKPTYIYRSGGEASRFPHGWMDHSVRVHRKSSATVHPSEYYSSLGGLIEEFPWDPGQELGFKPALQLGDLRKKRKKGKEAHSPKDCS